MLLLEVISGERGCVWCSQVSLASLFWNLSSPFLVEQGQQRALMLSILLEQEQLLSDSEQILSNEYLVSSSDHECAFGMCSKPHGLCRLPIAFLLLPLGFPPLARNAQPLVKTQATSLTPWQSWWSSSGKSVGMLHWQIIPKPHDSENRMEVVERGKSDQ